MMNGSKTLNHSPSAPITVESGDLSGLQLPNNLRAFLGVPYAAPPVGDLRWRAPQLPVPWEGVRRAEKFGPSAVQFPPPATSLYYGGETEFSEDCLYLNIWTGPEGAGNRPVLVWFHFGAFLFGSASNPICDGTRLAAEGVTVVTVNYRLGRFGFLAHRELSAESGHQASGNYGIMDQIAALQWVQRNIKAFGGDPSNVTAGGASAGAGSLHILRASPLAKGLFAKAICESGPGIAPTTEGSGHVAAYAALAAAEDAGAQLAKLLGASSVADMRKLPAQKILTTFLPSAQGPWKADLWHASSSLSVFDTANPIIDGHVLPDSLLTAHLSGQVADVPFLAGNVGNETSGLPYLASLADYHAFAKDYFGDLAEEALRLYPAAADSEVREATLQLLADQVFVWPTWTAARLQHKTLKSPAWYYKFLRAPPIPPDSDVLEKDFAGAFHVAGPPYAFGNLDARQWNWTDADRTLSENILDSWLRFLRTGKPSDDEGHAAAWPSLTSSSDLVKIWDLEPRLEGPGKRLTEVTAFWDRYYGID